jgi:hypothetical protein
LKSQLRALIIIVVAFSALLGILAASGEAGTNCGCGTPVGFPPTCVVAPCPAHEMMTMESYKVNSPTNATLTMRNTGWLSIGFSYYQVSQSNSAMFTHLNWTEPILPPNQALDATVVISGASFTFQPGTSYTITIVTLRNNPFTFTIKA